MGIKMHKLGERCDLFQEGGQVTDPAIDKRMDFHFNAILDVVSEWRKDKSQNQDTPLNGAELLLWTAQQNYLYNKKQHLVSFKR